MVAANPTKLVQVSFQKIASRLPFRNSIGSKKRTRISAHYADDPIGAMRPLYSLETAGDIPRKGGSLFLCGKQQAHAI